MLAATIRTPAAPGYRCPAGCWWEKDGCYCSDVAAWRSLRGAGDGVGTIVGLAVVGGLIWAAVGISKVARRGRR